METQRVFVHLSQSERAWIAAYAERNDLRHSGISETVRHALKLLKAVDSGDVRVTRVTEDGEARDVLILA